MHRLHGTSYLNEGDSLVKTESLGDCFYAILGQSNAKGIADYSGTLVNPTLPIYGAEDPAESYETAFPAVQLYTKVWVNPALTGLIDTGWTDSKPYDVAGNANMGFELELARYLNKYAPTTVRLAKFAVGGASMDDWLNPAGDYLINSAIPFLQARQKDLGGMRLGGVIWDQCEADATDATLSGQWSANMTTVMTKIRAVFGPKVPVVFKRISSSGTQTYNATVRTQNATYAAADSNSVMVDTDDTLLYDNLHYDTRSTQLMGARFGAAMLSLTHPISVGATTMPYFVGCAAQRMAYTTGGVTQPPVRWWGGTLAGDVGILVVVGTLRNQQPLSLVTAAGFALIGTFQSTNGTDHVFVSLYWCRADQTTINANSGHMPTVVLANSNHNNGGKIYVFRNCVASGTPFDAIATFANGAYGTSCSIPGATTVQANQLAALIAAGSAATSANDKLPSLTNADLANLALQKSGSSDTATTTAGEGFVALSLGTGEKATAGTFAATTATYPLSTLQANCSITLLGTNSGSAPSMSGVSQDATSLVYCPATLTEVNTALTAAGITSGTASIILLLQEASGNAADSSGNGFTFTALNAPSYANVDTGWTRKSVGAADGSNSNFSCTLSGLADPATTSYLWIFWAALTGTPAATRALARIGSTANQTVEAHVTTTPLAQIQSGATQVNGVTNVGTTWHPYVIQHDVTHSIQRVVTDSDVINASSFVGLAGKNVQLGKTTASLGPPAHFNYALGFTGAAAEWTLDRIRKFLLVCNWPMSWI